MQCEIRLLHADFKRKLRGQRLPLNAERSFRLSVKGDVCPTPPIAMRETQVCKRYRKVGRSCGNNVSPGSVATKRPPIDQARPKGAFRYVERPSGRLGHNHKNEWDFLETALQQSKVD